MLSRKILLALILVSLPLAANAQDNQLTRPEIDDGWILLFDGETTFGWEAENPANKDDWYVRDGVIACKSEAGFNHLRHKGAFADFILRLDFRVNAKGNSGVFFRAASDGFVRRVDGKDQVTGYEAQIDDNDPRGPLYQTGALYDVATAQKVIVGENTWRTLEIRAAGDHIVTKVNGETVVDVHDERFRKGHIGLQHHHPGNVVEFRNIKLKPLNMKPLFNGKDLTGWRVVDPPTKPGETLLRQHWKVRTGLLHVEVPPIEGVDKGGRGNLETTGMYGNFVLQIDARTNGEHLNSGVFFRCQPEKVGIGYEAQIRNQWEGDDRTKPVDFGTGAIYRRVPTRKVVSSDLQFFKMTLVAVDRNLSVWVDGYPVTSFTDSRPQDDNARNGYCPNPGTISLQSHDPTTNLDFKNIEIQEL